MREPAPDLSVDASFLTEPMHEQRKSEAKCSAHAARTHGDGSRWLTCIRLLALLLAAKIASAADPALVIVVNTGNPGTSSSNQFTLPLNASYSYDCSVDWGDSTSSNITTSASPTHTYSTSGIYTIRITENAIGGFPAIYFNDGGDCQKLLQIANWGSVTWSSMNGAFYGCSNMTITATDEATANTGHVSDFSDAWFFCSMMTTFPLLNTASGTDFSDAWNQCYKLASFPLIDTSNGTDFSFAWEFCDSLTSFPMINTGKGKKFTYVWELCYSLTSFPSLDTSNGTNFSGAWENCFNLTSFPMINTSKGTDFSEAWCDCEELNGFPPLDTSNGTDFSNTWAGCMNLTSYPQIQTFPLLNLWKMTNGTGCFNGSSLSSTSYSNLLIDLAVHNANSGVIFDGGNSFCDGSGLYSKHSVLEGTRGWTITDDGDTTNTQSISFPAIGDQTFGVAPITLAASASSGLPVYFRVISGPASVIDAMLTITGAGLVTVAADQAGNQTYPAAPEVSQTFSVFRQVPTILWPSPAAITYGTPLGAAQLDASSIPGNFVYSPPAGTVLAANPAAPLRLTFTPTDLQDYTTATVKVSITITKASQTITGFGALPGQTYGDSPFTISGVTGGGSIHPVVFASLSPNRATVSGQTVTMLNAGTANIQATQAGDLNHFAALPVTQQLVISKSGADCHASECIPQLWGSESGLHWHLGHGGERRCHHGLRTPAARPQIPRRELWRRIGTGDSCDHERSREPSG